MRERGPAGERGGGRGERGAVKQNRNSWRSFTWRSSAGNALARVAEAWQSSLTSSMVPSKVPWAERAEGRER